MCQRKEHWIESIAVHLSIVRINTNRYFTFVSFAYFSVSTRQSVEPEVVAETKLRCKAARLRIGGVH